MQNMKKPLIQGFRTRFLALSTLFWLGSLYNPRTHPRTWPPSISTSSRCFESTAGPASQRASDAGLAAPSPSSSSKKVGDGGRVTGRDKRDEVPLLGHGETGFLADDQSVVRVFAALLEGGDLFMDDARSTESGNRAENFHSGGFESTRRRRSEDSSTLHATLRGDNPSTYTGELV